MSGGVIWAVLGLFALNLAALIVWAATFRPTLVLTDGHDGRSRARAGGETRRIAGPVRGLARALRARVATAASAILSYRRSPPVVAARDATPTAEPATPPAEPATPTASATASDAALERWLSEMDAGDRAETAPPEDDHGAWWREWAESGTGNDSPGAAGSGRGPRPQRPPAAGMSA